MNDLHGGGLTPIGGGPATPPGGASSGGLTPIGGGLAPVGGAPSSPAAAAASSSPAPLSPPPAPATAQGGGPAARVAPPPPSAQQGGYPGGPSAPRPSAPPAAEASSGGGGAKIFLGVLAALAVLAAVAAFLVLRPTGPVAVPAKFTTFTAADGSFLVEAPEAWTLKPMGKAAPDGQRDHVGADGLRMQSGDAHVEVTFSSVAGLVGGQLLFGNEVVPESMVGARSVPIHRSLNKALKGRYKNYQAKPVERVPFESRMAGVAATKDQQGLEMDIRLSEFTADGNRFGLGGKRHGYMAAIGGGDLIASVVCECKESDWPKLKPAFERVLASIAEAGEPEGGGIGVPGTGVTVPKVGGGY